jgi:hypothetical protein
VGLFPVTRRVSEAGLRGSFLLAAIVAVFLLSQWSQIAATPIGEGLDVYNHLAYIEFMAREGRWPISGEPSIPADLGRLEGECLAADKVCPGSYSRWAHLSDAERSAVRHDVLMPDPAAPYVSDNYQSQHPPLYYALASIPYRAVRHLPLDRQVFWLSVLSVALAAAGLPALWITFRRHLPSRDSALLLLAIAWFPNLMPFLGRITNDSLAFSLVCWWICAVDRQRLRTIDVIAGGALLAVGFLTKTYMLALVPVYLLVCLLGGTRRRAKLAWPHLALGALLVLAGTAPLVLFNWKTSGMPLPLDEVRRTASFPLSQKVAALWAVDPFWFLAGLARNFFWCGYYSFVSPHILYYLPLAAPLALLWPARKDSSHPSPAGRWKAVADRVWVHGALPLVFILAMWWHAALFSLDASARGVKIYSGNEGWYMNVLIGSIGLLLAVACQERFGDALARRVLRWAALLMVGWNVAARVVMIAFWGGGVQLVGRARLAVPGQVARALVDPVSWRNWHSWPGVIAPGWLSILPALLVAVAISAWLLYRQPEASGASATGERHSA